jgi:DNA mismatch repair protein MutS
MTLIEHYHAAKERHPNMLLAFRCGDLYELFGEDAETASKILGLTVTSRDRILPMAGFPHHQLETNLHRLLKAGQRVAICEQVESPTGKVPGEIIPVDAERYQPTLFGEAP